MLKDSSQTKTSKSEHVKCVKCKQKDATGDDQMCDSCRYLVALEGIISTS